MSNKGSRFLLLCCSLIVFAPLGRADIIPIGSISLSSDFPLIGEQEISIFNLTGSAGCYALYPVCSNLAFQNWTLTVNYQSSLYNQGSGSPSLPSPYVVQWQSSLDDILPGAPAVFDFDLCGSADVTSCAAPTTTISSIVFSGSISPTNFPLSGGANFFADPAFSVTLVPSNSYPSDYFEAQDITVRDQSINISPTPEPSFYGVLAAAISVVLVCKRRISK